ncbi:HNH endonuclease [Yinghuangia aomiensis]
MRTWMEVPASRGLTTATVLLDVDDFLQLDGRRLSIGSHGYAQMWNRPGVVLLHRWLMGIPTGTKYRRIVDHINRNRLDCRRANLRIVTPAESNLNRTIAARDLPLGVYRTANGRYATGLKRNRVMHRFGTFATPEQAAAAVEAGRAELDAHLFAA